MKGVGNEDAKENWHWDLNLGTATIRVVTTWLLVLPLPQGLGSRRDLAGRKGVERLLLVGHEKGAMWVLD